jgi:hypothetical protein
MNLRVFCVALAVSALAAGQSVSVGLIGGDSVTNDFHNSFQPYSFQLPPVFSREYSTSERYIVGGMVEVQLPRDWSVEVDGLYHPLRIENARLYPDGTSTFGSPLPVFAYEFPVLAKYRFRWGAWRPFVEAGPSFRVAGNLNGTYPSPYGVAAGVGAEARLGKFRIAPEVRYIRWESSSAALTRSDQIELITSFSTAGEVPETGRSLARRISLGVVTGVTLSPDFPSVQGSGTQNISPTQAIPTTYSDSSGPRSFIAGLMVEIAVGKAFALEADAIYRPMRARYQDDFGGVVVSGSQTTNTLTYPILGKYRFSVRAWKPFVEAGPSFRYAKNTGGSASGLTAGVGIENHFRRLKIAPVLRYTYWGPNSDVSPGGPSRNDLEALGEFFF